MRTIQREIVGAFIFSSDDKVLLGHSGVFEGDWCVPGGGMDEGESKRTALNREILEEVGLDISAIDADSIEGKNGGVSEKTLRDTKERVIVEMNFYDYVVRIPESASEISLKMEDDFTGARWFSRKELNQLEIAPGTKLRLDQLGYLA